MQYSIMRVCELKILVLSYGWGLIHQDRRLYFLLELP